MKKTLFCPNQGGPLDGALLPPYRPPFGGVFLYLNQAKLALLDPSIGYRPPMDPPQGGVPGYPEGHWPASGAFPGPSQTSVESYPSTSELL